VTQTDPIRDDKEEMFAFTDLGTGSRKPKDTSTLLNKSTTTNWWGGQKKSNKDKIKKYHSLLKKESRRNQNAYE